MAYNKNPISLRDGNVYLEGVLVFDSVKFKINFTPDVWTGRVLGERSPSTRWLGYSISGEMTRRRATKWLKEKIDQYRTQGITPEFTIQGISDDPNSDYYGTYGANTVTAVGCVLTGDLNIIELDSEGQIADDVLTFNVKDVM